MLVDPACDRVSFSSSSSRYMMDPTWTDPTCLPLQNTYALPGAPSNAVGSVGWDTMLDQLTGQMTAAQLARRRSGRRPDLTSAASFRAPSRHARVGKLSSAGNSPKTAAVRAGRRRTTSTSNGAAAVMAAPARWRSSMIDTQQSGSRLQPSQDGMRATPGSTRPITWHPTSDPATTFYHHQNNNNNNNTASDAYRHPSGEFASWGQSWALDGTMPWREPSTPSLYAASETASPLIPCSPPTSSFDLHDLEFPSIYDSTLMEPYLGTYSGLPYGYSQPPKLSLSIPGQSLAMDLPDSSLVSTIEPSGLSAWPYLTSATSPETSSFLPIQRPDLASDEDLAGPVQEGSSSDSDSGELVGMGLYDDVVPSKTALRTTGLRSSRAAELSEAGRRRTGKGLKLEERWEPPDGDGHQEDSRESRAGESARPETSSNKADDAVPDLIAAGSFLLDEGDRFDDRHLLANGLYNYDPLSSSTAYSLMSTSSHPC